MLKEFNSYLLLDLKVAKGWNFDRFLYAKFYEIILVFCIT